MTDTIRSMEQSLYKMPIVVRARGYRLYDLYGKRYIDLYQNNGRAILGHRSEGLLRSMKAVASRGLVSEYPSVYDGRLEKILKLLFPEYPVFRIYRNRERALFALGSALNLLISPDGITDPAMNDAASDVRVSYWRPFLPEMTRFPEVLLPIFPFPGSFAPEVVCLRDRSTAAMMPPSDMVSPFLLDTLIKTVTKMIKVSRGSGRKSSEFQRLMDVFEWKRRGPYINTGLDSVAYSELCKKALSEGVLLPPGEHLPMIMPREFSDGELEGFTHFVRQMTGD